jgi:hypothetical protein
MAEAVKHELGFPAFKKGGHDKNLSATSRTIPE